MTLYNYFPDGGKRCGFGIRPTLSALNMFILTAMLKSLECNAFTNKVHRTNFNNLCPFPVFSELRPRPQGQARHLTVYIQRFRWMRREFVFSIITNTNTFGAADGSGNVMKLAATITGDYFQAGRYREGINTKQGEKSAVLIHGSYTTNVIKWLTSDSTFLNIKQGANSFSVIDESVCRFGLIYNTTYRGV